MNESKLLVFIPVWDRNIELLDKYCLPSLLQEGQFADRWAQDTEFRFWTTSEDHGAVIEVVGKHLNRRTTHFAVDYRDRPDQVLSEGIKELMTEARSSDCRMLMVTSDMVYSRGSISNLLQYAKGKPVTVAGSHLRVDRANFMEHWNGCLQAPYLVSAAMQFPFMHRATLTAMSEADNSVIKGGISVTWLDTRLWSIVHYIPQPVLAYFTDDDLVWWEEHHWLLGAWDHDWPELLIATGRMRYLGSSDLYFAVELTDADNNVPVVTPGSARLEQFYRVGQHHKVAGCYVGCLRGIDGSQPAGV